MSQYANVHSSLTKQFAPYHTEYHPYIDPHSHFHGWNKSKEFVEYLPPSTTTSLPPVLTERQFELTNDQQHSNNSGNHHKLLSHDRKGKKRDRKRKRSHSSANKTIKLTSPIESFQVNELVNICEPPNMIMNVGASSHHGSHGHQHHAHHGHGHGLGHHHHHHHHHHPQSSSTYFGDLLSGMTVEQHQSLTAIQQQQQQQHTTKPASPSRAMMQGSTHNLTEQQPQQQQQESANMASAAAATATGLLCTTVDAAAASAYYNATSTRCFSPQLLSPPYGGVDIVPGHSPCQAHMKAYFCTTTTGNNVESSLSPVGHQHIGHHHHHHQSSANIASAVSSMPTAATSPPRSHQHQKAIGGGSFNCAGSTGSTTYMTTPESDYETDHDHITTGGVSGRSRSPPGQSQKQQSSEKHSLQPNNTNNSNLGISQLNSSGNVAMMTPPTSAVVDSSIRNQSASNNQTMVESHQQLSQQQSVVGSTGGLSNTPHKSQRQSLEGKFCFGCGESLSISDDNVSVAGFHEWHADCLCCSECGQSLEKSCYIRNGRAYCRTDYLKSIKCSKCQRTFSPGVDWVRQARDQAYHLACFACDHCKRQLDTGDRFAIVRHRLICKLHFTTTTELEEQANQQNVTENCNATELSQDNDGFSTVVNSTHATDGKSVPMNSSTITTSAAASLNSSQISPSVHNGSSTNNSINSLSQTATSAVVSLSNTKTKRVRTTFTEEQLSVLQANFQMDSNPDGQDLERIASETGLTKRVTQVWFQNSRARQKKYMNKNQRHSAAAAALLSSGGPNGPAVVTSVSMLINGGGSGGGNGSGGGCGRSSVGSGLWSPSSTGSSNNGISNDGSSNGVSSHVVCTMSLSNGASMSTHPLDSGKWSQPGQSGISSNASQCSESEHSSHSSPLSGAI